MGRSELSGTQEALTKTYIDLLKKDPNIDENQMLRLVGDLTKGGSCGL